MKLRLPNKVVFTEAYRLTQEGKNVIIPLRGRSMRPFLEDNRDRALLGKLQTPKVGDPVLAEYAPGKYLLHRIVKIEGNVITSLGDGNLSPEQYDISSLRCRVIGFYRKGRQTLDPVDGWKWKCYSAVWMRLTPVRRWLLAFHRHIWLKLFPPSQLSYDQPMQRIPQG